MRLDSLLNEFTSMNYIWFLLRLIHSSWLHWIKLSFLINLILLFDAYNFLSPFPKLGNYFNLLSLKNTCYNVCISARLGQYSIKFSAILISTNVLLNFISSGNWVIRFLNRSIDFMNYNFRIFLFNELSLLFFIRISWMSGRFSNSSGICYI